MGKKKPSSKKPQQEQTPTTTQSKPIKLAQTEESPSKEQNNTVQPTKEKQLEHYDRKKGSNKTDKKEKIKQFKNGIESQKYRHYKWEEVGKHDHKDDIWIVIEDNVYDMSKFVDNHPGGVKPILRRAGRNATKAFNAGNHPPNILLHKLGKWKIGRVDPDSMIESWQRQTKTGKMDAFCSLVLGVGLISFMTYLTF